MSLLEKSKSLDTKTPSGKDIDPEVFEVAVAYINGEVSMPAIAKAMNVSTSSANGRIMSTIYDYVRNNPSCLNGKK